MRSAGRQESPPRVEVATNFQSVAGGGEDGGTALLLVENFRARGGQSVAQGGFVRAFAEGVGAAEHDDRGAYGAEECFGRGEVCAVAPHDYNIAAQCLTLAADKGVLGSRAGIGHEQDAETFKINPCNDALVVGLTGGLAGLWMENAKGCVFPKVFEVTGQGERFSQSGGSNGGMEVVSRPRPVAQGGIDDPPWFRSFEGKNCATKMVGITMGDDKGIEPRDTRGPQRGLDDAAEITFRPGVEQPGLFSCPHELRPSVAEVEDGDPRGGLEPAGRK